MGRCGVLRLAWMAVVVVAALTKVTTVIPKPIEECRKVDEVLGEGSVSIVDSFSIINGNGGYLYLYFYPNEGFQGISVEGFGREGKTSVWFPSDTGTECFRRTEFHWWRVDVVCTYNKDTQYIWFYMHIGNCRWSCAKKHVAEDLVRINLVAYGPSQWRREFPDHPCLTEWLYPAPHQDFCWDPPPYVLADATNDTGTATSKVASINLTLVLLASVVAVVVIVVVVVVVVVKVRARREEREAEADGKEATVYYDVMDPRRSEPIYEDIDQITTTSDYITPLPPTSEGLRRVFMMRDKPSLPFPSRH